MNAPRTADKHAPVAAKLSTLDRFLPVWIGFAMAAGLLLGRWIPGLNTALERVQLDGISLRIALGLLIMMYPVLAKVRYDRLDTVTSDRKHTRWRAETGVRQSRPQAIPSRSVH